MIRFDQHFIKAVILCFGLSMGLNSCSTPEAGKSQDPDKLQTFSSDHMYSSEQQPLCKAMLDNYCNILYSPETQGNLEVRRTQDSIKVLQGETRNQFSQVFFRYSQAKLQNRRNLPKDFYRILDRNSYFEKLKLFLDRAPRTVMSLEQRLSSEQMDYELGFIWSTSFNEVILARIELKYPGFHKLPESMIPVELQLEKRRLHRTLVSELSQALWRGDKNWKKVEQGFKSLQASYLRMIDNLDIPDDTRKTWSQKISDIRLVLPGAFPAISSEECSSTTVNAFYYTYLNVLTICAGDFNSEDILQTLGHEMGHALGIDRSQYLFAMKSPFGQKLSTMRHEVCQPKTFSCDHWSAFKQEFNQALTSLDGYQTELPEFQRCLKRRETSKSLSAEDIARFARNLTADRISDLASSDRFLRVTKPELPTPNGKSQKNPNYLNPCSYYLWSQGEEPVDDELTTMIFFTAEYRCSTSGDSQRLKQSIETAKTMTDQVLEKTLKIEGEYSARSVLETEGFSSPPFERFADVIGSYALAQLLGEMPNHTDRQNRFLASSSWQCLEPSLASHFPEESSVEKEYIFDPHLEGDQRRKELISAPIREVISCEKDFEFKECSLPFRSGRNAKQHPAP
jgi:hypothetical protein